MDQPRMPIRIEIPTINDAPSDFDKLFELWNKVRGYSLDIVFDFSRCNFLRPNAIAFLGGLARLVDNRGGQVLFDWKSVNDKVLTILRQNGFAATFEYKDLLGGPGNSIPYREDNAYANNVETNVVNYLKFKWLGNGWVHVSSKLRDAIVGRVCEIYDNAFSHSGSRIGVFSCGQYFWQMQVLKLAVVDFGVGIPMRVRKYFKRQGLDAKFCLTWAFQEGTSTIKGIGRGNGLSLLKEFVKVNHGTLEVYSQDGYALISDEKENFSNRQSFFKGTVVNITFRCDKRYYQLADENIAKEPLF